MSESSSHRQILRSTTIIGSASIINILLGLLRIKVAAVLLGPTGIGMIGLFQNLMTTASAVSALGFGNVGTRQIAEAAGRGDTRTVIAARRALFWGTLALAIFGAIIFWTMRDSLAKWVVGDAGQASSVGWLALGVALTVAAGSQAALLNGLRRIGDIARVSVLSAILSTIFGICGLLLWQEKGLLVFVLSAPLASFLIGHVYVSRLPKVDAPQTPLPLYIDQWRTLVRLGTAFMIAGLAATLGQLAVRTLVQRELGPESLGHFTAAWMISMTYIGFVLQAMSTDFYPRLTAVIHDSVAVNRMVNEQTEVALLLAGPVLLAMLGLAPWIIELLYSRQFSDAADVLRWQILGDLLKVASWPLGFIILASGDGRTFMLTESFAMTLFVGLTWLGLPLVGLVSTGLAFLGMYAIYLPLVYCLARRRTGFLWSSAVRHQLALIAALAICVAVVTWISQMLGALLGCILAMGLAVHSASTLAQHLDDRSVVGLALKRFRRLFVRKNQI